MQSAGAQVLAGGAAGGGYFLKELGPTEIPHWAGGRCERQGAAERSSYRLSLIPHPYSDLFCGGDTEAGNGAKLRLEIKGLGSKGLIFLIVSYHPTLLNCQ